MLTTELKIVFLYLVIIFCKISSHNIQKRYLIFPQQNPTRYQFICGIGIPPPDLDPESLTVGYVLKAEYFLPYNATMFRQNPFVPEFRESRTSRNTKSSTVSRFQAYKAFEQIISRFGFNGNECLLNAICESARIPYVQHFDVYSDLFHIFLTPSSTTEFVLDRQLQIYYGAEQMGKAGESCDTIYKYCNNSLIKLMSIFS